MVNSIKDLENLNRKQKNKMSHTKGSRPIDKVIIQEGVPTNVKFGVNKHTAEPVIYMLGHNIIGGFYRVHKNRNFNENLNMPGMHFEPIEQQPDDFFSNCFYSYSVVARLACLASAYELKSVKIKDNNIQSRIKDV